MTVALCKCGYFPGSGAGPNDLYTILSDVETAPMRAEVAKFQSSEIGFRVVKYFDTKQAAVDYARQHGLDIGE